MALKAKFSLSQLRERMSVLEILDVLEDVRKSDKNFDPMLYSLQVSPLPGRMENLKAFLPEDILPGHLTEVECGLLTHDLLYALKSSRFFPLVEKLLQQAKAVHLKFARTDAPEGYEIKTIQTNVCNT